MANYAKNGVVEDLDPNIEIPVSESCLNTEGEGNESAKQPEEKKDQPTQPANDVLTPKTITENKSQIPDDPYEVKSQNNVTSRVRADQCADSLSAEGAKS